MHTITNKTAAAIYVGLISGGSVAVMPGESRPFHLDDLAPAWRPDPNTETATVTQEATDEADVGLQAMAAQSAKDFIAELAAAPVDALTDADLKRLAEIESAKPEPRKTVLGAIQETLLARAGAAKAADNGFAASGSTGASA